MLSLVKRANSEVRADRNVGVMCNASPPARRRGAHVAGGAPDAPQLLEVLRRCHRVWTSLKPTKFASWLSARFRSLDYMRTRDNIDAELRLLVAVRQSFREQSGEPSSCQINELLDEKADAHVG
mgnify:CR=1 FL=1